jgi:hypothetical protein
MPTLESQLRDFMVQNGVSWGEAERAAAACSQKIKMGAKTGFVAGLLIGAYTSNPGALVMALAGAGGGAALTLAYSPSCEEVREAAGRLLVNAGSM